MANIDEKWVVSKWSTIAFLKCHSHFNSHYVTMWWCENIFIQKKNWSRKTNSAFPKARTQLFLTDIFIFSRCFFLCASHSVCLSHIDLGCHCSNLHHFGFVPFFIFHFLISFRLHFGFCSRFYLSQSSVHVKCKTKRKKKIKFKWRMVNGEYNYGKMGNEMNEGRNEENNFSKRVLN